MDNWKNKQKIIVQLVCLLLSLGLWIYVTNIENPIKSYELSRVPVEIKNADSLKDAGLALSPNQEFYVNLKIEGNSQDLFSVDKSDFTISVDLNEFVLKNGENKITVNIENSPSTVKIKNSNGLTITIKTEAYSTKEVPVKSKINVISKSSYYVATPIFSPETIIVSGPESLVNKVTKVVAEGEESNAVKTIVKNYIVTPVDENDKEVTGVELSQKWAEATIEINQGKTVPIKINTTGTLSSGLRLKSISSTTTEIGITGPESALNSINEIGTETINLSEIKDSTNIDVALGIPDGILIHNGENSITVSIVVEKVQTKEFTIDYSMIGQQEGINIVPDNNKVTITVSGFEDVLNTLTEANFTAELDVSEYTEEGEFSKAPTVNLVGVDNVNIDNVSEIKLTVSKDIPTNGDEVQEEVPQQ
ncbi:YbbR-like domain-containing protein [uncultured Clostridium sp.]|uniref:CdaR family protein n=1 Tax=uncultured Clostridium sp. TaxID=59620 RepID=UPI0025F55F0F|nr:CdaR family protein [uncultured Clostridium sp.]